uniref:Uncharacterized protein n=1 Tax=Spongospora subterranea TaxID=70186 RepID=A0A0H5QH54_9EUKA|eukprot:CRZ01298.1 hypothetical protein [Spongospora subterranea]
MTEYRNAVQCITEHISTIAKQTDLAVTNRDLVVLRELNDEKTPAAIRSSCNGVLNSVNESIRMLNRLNTQNVKLFEAVAVVQHYARGLQKRIASRDRLVTDIAQYALELDDCSKYLETVHSWGFGVDYGKLACSHSIQIEMFQTLVAHLNVIIGCAEGRIMTLRRSRNHLRSRIQRFVSRLDLENFLLFMDDNSRSISTLRQQQDLCIIHDVARDMNQSAYKSYQSTEGLAANVELLESALLVKDRLISNLVKRNLSLHRQVKGLHQQRQKQDELHGTHCATMEQQVQLLQERHDRGVLIRQELNTEKGKVVICGSLQPFDLVRAKRTHIRHHITTSETVFCS